MYRRVYQGKRSERKQGPDMLKWSESWQLKGSWVLYNDDGSVADRDAIANWNRARRAERD